MSGCTRYDIARLAGDDTAGRDNGTAGSALARQYLTEQLRAISSDVRTQAIGGGTNVVAVIPGTDLANKYVVVGAHYDHLGSSCQFKSSGDQICNGATDNAAGVASVLAIGRAIAAQPTKPRRSVVLALWDSEEDGLLGSRYYADHPLVPLADTVAYVNFDIQGSNVSPSLRQHELRRRGRERRRALPVDRPLRDQREQTLDTEQLQLDLRPEPQRLRLLPREAGAERLLHRRDRAVLPHQPTTRSGSSTSTSSTSRSRSRCGSHASWPPRTIRPSSRRVRRS